MCVWERWVLPGAAITSLWPSARTWASCFLETARLFVPLECLNNIVSRSQWSDVWFFNGNMEKPNVVTLKGAFVEWQTCFVAAWHSVPTYGVTCCCLSSPGDEWCYPAAGVRGRVCHPVPDVRRLPSCGSQRLLEGRGASEAEGRSENVLSITLFHALPVFLNVPCILFNVLNFLWYLISWFAFCVFVLATQKIRLFRSHAEVDWNHTKTARKIFEIDLSPMLFFLLHLLNKRTCCTHVEVFIEVYLGCLDLFQFKSLQVYPVFFHHPVS